MSVYVLIKFVWSPCFDFTAHVYFSYLAIFHRCSFSASMPSRGPGLMSVSVRPMQVVFSMSWTVLVFASYQDNSYFFTDRGWMHIEWWGCKMCLILDWLLHGCLYTVARGQHAYHKTCLRLSVSKDMVMPESGETQQSVCEAVGGATEADMYVSDQDDLRLLLQVMSSKTHYELIF